MPSGELQQELHRKLRERARELRLDIQRELRKYDDETYSELATRVADSGEQAWSDLLSDVNLAEITRDIEEMRDIERALARISEGSYGTCIDCGQSIDERRLEANPAAIRCLDCQSAWENRDQTTHYRSL